MTRSQHHRKLILVKHAEPVVDPRVPPNRWVLSEQGEQQSTALAEWLRRYDTGEVIVTSEEPKAAQTAFAVARRLGKRVETFPGLHEHDRTGAPFGTQAEFERAAQRFFENPDELVWGNETAEEARARFALAIEGVLGRYPAGDVIVVSHGTVITLFVARDLDLDAYRFWRQLGLPSFCVLESPGNRLREVVADLTEGSTRPCPGRR